MKIGLFNIRQDIDLMKHGNKLFSISLLFLLLSIVLMIFKGLSLGIDFKGGIVLDLRPTSAESSQNFLRKSITQLGINDFIIKEFGNNDLQLIINNSLINETNQAASIIENIKNNLQGFVFLQTQYVGPSISSELIKNSVLAVFASFLIIIVYLWFRFDWQYGLVGVIAIFHDILISFFFLSLFSYEINISTIAALLTIVGYSINDTVVLFDQVRENTRKYLSHSVKDILNRSVAQILSRSLSTSLTLVLVLLTIFLFGGESLRSFSFTLLVGVIVGTYSSIYIATPLLMHIGDIKKKYLKD